jgi:cytochrome oxidase Cu insertion factor (SCO1/SenC/PrrC family)
MTGEKKFVYTMVVISLLLVGAFITFWKISSNRVMAGKSDTMVERFVDRDIELVDADGKARGFTQLKGKVSLVSHVFTRCPGQCAGIGIALNDVRKELRGQGPLQLVSVSLDPAHDRPEHLKKFATQHDLLGEDWWFVTGEADSLNRYMAEVFLLKAEEKPPEKRTNEFDLFDHRPMVALVDHNLRILGWYYPFDERSGAAMREALKAALAAAKKAA